ncbi:hypothetical protein GH714_021488 [Hevea brasiliensis]|uniref:glucan endo-1,3-beta-D-glucosidase n=1 Tax=Hevea brasiliensis TaxID=3981 RepID=A0A6A6LU00_HEVBR|nr:hypothetical protein GH714_021488 [Hevea brasiliensis]
MVDPNTLLHYTNVLDAMIDAAYFSMKNLNITDVVVLVTETGWPSKEVTSSVYIYELFNEDLRSPPVSEANWGLFYGNSTPVYLLHVYGSGTFLANDTTNQTYCIAMDGVDSRTLQAALDWACGPGTANCSEIQPGEDCYQPNNVKNHASYAFDSYYQKEGKAPGSCDFKGVAMITTTDPSHGSCIFPEDDCVKLGGFQGFGASNKSVTVAKEDTSSSATLSSFKILSYNVWFREELELHKRMKALGDLIQLHSPDVICFQLSKLPVKSFSSRPFNNSVMGRELCIVELEVQPNKHLVVATSHLESPCPAPPTWDQMFSKNV